MPQDRTALALLPLIAAILMLTAKFYIREGAISVFSVSFMLATFAVAMLIGYMVLQVLGLCPPTRGSALAASGRCCFSAA